MRRKFTKLLAAIALLVFMTPTMVGWGQTKAESVHYTLDGTITGGTSGYAEASNITQNGMNWEVTGNTTMNPWRIGGKNIDGVDRPIKSTTAMGSAISKVEVSVGNTASSLTVNSIKLVVASDASFNTVLDEITKTSNLTNTTLTFTPTSGTEWATSAYYNIVFNVTRTSSSGNGYITFNYAKFYKQEGGTPTCATPTFSLNSGITGTTTYSGDKVLLDCQTNGATIYYTTSNTDTPPADPTNASTAYTSAGITLSENTIIKAVAYDGTNYSDVVTKSYTVLTPLTTMGDIFNAATAANSTATDVAVTFGNWIVSGVTIADQSSNVKRAFVTDGTKGFIIYNGSGGLTFQKGQVLSGTKVCQVRLLNGAPCVMGLNASDFIITQTGQSPTVTTTTISALEAVNTGAVVDLGVLTWTGSVFKDANNNEINNYNTMYTGSFTTNQAYNVKGVFVYYSGNTNPKEIAPRDANDITQTSTFTVTYDGNGADGGTTPTDNTQYTNGQTVTVLANTFTKTGHTFDYWTKDAEGNDGPYEAGDEFFITANTTFYAQWGVNSYSYTLNVTGEDTQAEAALYVGGQEHSGSINYGTEVTVVVATNTGYTYSIAVKDADDNDVIVTDDKFTMPASNVAITVTTTQVSQHTITFVAGTGSCNTASVTEYEGASITLPTANPPATCSGWVFAGWALSSISETTTAPTLLNGTYTMGNSDATLYAVYSLTEGSAFDNTAGGDFMIYAVVNNTNYYATGTGKKLSSVTDADDATVYTFEKLEGEGYGDHDYAIKSGSYYIGYGTSGTDFSTSTTAYKWTISSAPNDAFGTWRISASTGTNRGFIFQVYSTNNQTNTTTYTYQFGAYSTGNVDGDDYFDVEIGGGTTTYNSNPNCMETVAAPEFSPVGGTYTSAQNVTITCTTGEAIIKYKTNENDDWSTYSSAISVSTTTTIWAKATKEGMNDSEVVSATYTIVEPFTPVVYTRASSINSNGHYIIVGFNGEDAYAMGDQSGSIRSAVVISEDGTNAIVVNENVFDFVISGNTTDGYTIYDSEKDGYLCAVSSNSNYIGTGDSEAWSITFDQTDGYATVVSKNTNYDRVDLRYNYNSGNTPRFSCYKTSTTMSHVYLYEKSTSVTPTNNSTTVVATDFSATTPAGYRLIASPVNMLNPKAIDGMLSGNYDLYAFDQNEEGAEWRNYKVESFLLESGKGYLYASASGTAFSFIGAPYAGNGVVSLDYTDGKNLKGWNLIGNPFANPATLNMPYYKMNDDGDGFTAKIEDLTNPVGIMEGVFVQATAVNQTATFTAQTSKGGRQSGIAKANLNVIGANGTVIDNAIVRFDEGQTLEKFMLHADGTKIFFTEDHKDYAIIRSEAHGEMPVNFKAAENGTYTIDVEAENLEVNYLHLIDNLTGMDVDLLATPSYTFEARKSDIASRFRLVFDANTGNDETNDNFAFINNGELIVNGNGTVQVIDILGRQMFSHEVNSAFRIQNSSFAPGVYVLRLVNGNDVKTQKIVIK